MKVEIWSDIMCPFCYIGKKRFENALAGFENNANIQVEWKSFQLMPDIKTQKSGKFDDFLVEYKGMSPQHAKGMTDQILTMAAETGLVYDFEHIVPANTLNAHRFTHFAKQYGLQNEAEEALFRSHFTEAKNIDDLVVLIQLGQEIGLDTKELKTALEKKMFTEEIYNDIRTAEQLGIRGVPFFLFNGKYAVSGAQAIEQFNKVLKQSYMEWRQENPEIKLAIIEGKVCTTDGHCE